MQIRRQIKTTKPESAFDVSLEQELLSFIAELAQAVNKGLKFEDNFNAAIITVADSGVADSENTVAHTLKRVPIGFLVLNINKAGTVYDSGTAWTTENIYLKCDVVSCAIKLLIF
jgi:hypothetical protein